LSEYSVTGLHEGSGFTYNGRGGATCISFTLVYLGGSDYWYPADADAAATMPVLGLVIGGLTIGDRGKILLKGLVNNNAWAWTPGVPLYASTVAGELTETEPVGPGDVSQMVAYSITATTIYFSPGFGGGASGSQINLGGVLTDHSFAGILMEATAGETVNIGDACYMKADGLLWIAKADAPATMPAVAMATATITAGNSGVFLLYGNIRDNSWAWTVGSKVYVTVTGTTGNTLTHTIPAGTGYQIQPIAIAFPNADTLFFNPNLSRPPILYEVQTGDIAAPSTTPLGNGFTLMLYNSTAARYFICIYGNALWKMVEVL